MACNKEVFIQGRGMVTVYEFDNKYYVMRPTGRVVALTLHQEKILRDCDMNMHVEGMEDFF
jgi:hypothetical protein